METLSEPFRQELASFVSRFRRPRVTLFHLLLLAAFGFWIPWWKSIDFLDPVLLSAYACLSAVFAAPAASEMFDGSDGISFQRVKARVLISVMYGEIMALLLLGAGVATVYATHWNGFVPPPDLESLARGEALGITASFALSWTAAWLALQFSPSVARGALRIIFLALLVALFYWGRWLPSGGLQGAIACAGFGSLVLILLKRKLRQS